MNQGIWRSPLSRNIDVLLECCNFVRSRARLIGLALLVLRQCLLHLLKLRRQVLYLRL